MAGILGRMPDESAPQTVEVKFDVVGWDEVAYDEPVDGPKLTRITIRKTYRGVLDGTGVAEVLAARGAEGSGYLASERIVGTLDGRRGDFVLQHGGLDDRGRQNTFGTIVPNSGTGELSGLAGQVTEVGHSGLTLTYTIR